MLKTFFFAITHDCQATLTLDYLLIFILHLDTTDVQAIRATATEVTNQIKINCDFIPGSEAEGCMVELKATEGLDNTTVNLTRNYNSSEAVGFFNLPFPLSCYEQVYAFDIEVDGSIGIMPLPGEIDNNLTNIHSPESCSQRSTSKH